MVFSKTVEDENNHKIRQDIGEIRTLLDEGDNIAPTLTAPYSLVIIMLGPDIVRQTNSNRKG